MEFTHEQLFNWNAYERVRQRGTYNMFDPAARRATGLEKNEYLFVMEHYSELKAAVEAKKGAK